jgi:hypothetical protein
LPAVFVAGRAAPLRFASTPFFAGALAGAALRTGAFSAAVRFFKAGFGRADLAAVLLLLVVDFVAVLNEAGREASLLALLTT